MATEVPPPMPVPVDQIVEQVFSTMLGTSVVCTDQPWTRDEHRLTSVVHFAGERRGAILIECSISQACQFTHRLSGVSVDRLTEDVIDCLGELANMVGGNLKSALQAGVGVSMPSVVEGSDYTMRICGNQPILRYGFDSEFGPFWVTFVEESV